ncbi:Dihydropteroate synthase 1 [Arcanobacterium haemolyticum]|uniref:dihydropteroate synthase n=1 Tax=Arcanobacterium haemolyticum TaxID=28264 RepID=UPI000D9DAA11|nr:dihydropteroate synthase [Arcanobacterium haemolyticum]SPT74894.1 Dihydropteroate synthase 1 [Arcanobacterium haemolyticum]
MHIMGIVNVTPDSFSDGGKWATPETAIQHGTELMDAGATILDIGGESTRPGARALEWDEEWERIANVIEELSRIGQERGVAVSVDTYHAETARRSVEAGASIVNDVTGGNGDPAMLETVAKLDCDYILQHSRGTAETMNSLATYTNIVDEVVSELVAARERALAAGIDAERIILDPGLGFAKMGDDDWNVLGGIDRVIELGHRVLVGASRKRFIGHLVGENQAHRDLSTAVISGFLAEHGVWAARVHNVDASSVVLATLEKIQQHSKKTQ